jgi:hypothetical protein
MSDEAIKKIEEQIEKLKARKQSIVNREKQKDRKDRTRRLIQIGAIIEKYFDLHSIEEAEALGEIATADQQKADNLKRMVKARAVEILSQKQKEKPETT